MIEIIVMIGVVWNACLQTYWFYWTLKNHSHKHIENNPENLPKEMVTNSLEGYVATPKSKDEVFSGERKYDPNKVKGVFDNVFK